MSARYTVFVLFLVMVLSFVDRQILAILLEPIKHDLGASDSEMGLLTGFAFVLFFAVAALPIARASDAYSRRTIIAVALGFWSVMTMLSGGATSFLQLAAARAGLGIGEAATSPASQSMLSDLFSGSRRTGVLSLLAVAAPIGVMLAFMIGGWLSEAVGWRVTFVAVGAPGLVLALLVRLTLREPQRGGAERTSADVQQHTLAETVSYLLSLRSLRFITTGASLNLLCAWSMTVWSATYLIRVHGMETARAGAAIGLGSGVGGIAGTVFGGFLAQRLARRNPQWLLRVPAITSALSIPFNILFLTMPPAFAPLMYLAAAFFGSCMIGPMLSLPQSLAKVRMRALAASLVALTFNVVGTGFGPLVVGVLSDLLAPRFGVQSIRYAMLAPATLAMAGAALCFHAGARHVRDELERAMSPARAFAGGYTADVASTRGL